MALVIALVMDFANGLFHSFCTSNVSNLILDITVGFSGTQSGIQGLWVGIPLPFNANHPAKPRKPDSTGFSEVFNPIPCQAR